jgi:hypothetical protein
MVTDSNGDLVLEHKPTGGQFKFDSANNAWTPVQGLAMGGANISGAGSFDSNDADVSGPMVSNSVDTGSINSDSITNSGQVETQDLTVTGSVVGVGGGVALESSDNISIDTISGNTTSGSLVTLFSGSSSTVLGGHISTAFRIDWQYTFSDGNVITLGGTPGSFNGLKAQFKDQAEDRASVGFLPAAKDVTKVEVGALNATSGSGSFSAFLYRV